MRLRLSDTNVVTFAQETIPELVPESFKADRLVGHRCAAFGVPEFRHRFGGIAAKARRSKQPARIDWPSLKTGGLRMGVILPHANGQITLRIFATAQEVAGIAKERRRTGTNGD